MLIALGVLVIIPLLTHWRHTHKNREKPEGHTHEHGVTNNHCHSHSHMHKSDLTGVVQGLAGSAAIMLVTLTTVGSLELGIVFILVFGTGVILVWWALRV